MTKSVQWKSNFFAVDSLKFFPVSSLRVSRQSLGPHTLHRLPLLTPQSPHFQPTLRPLQLWSAPIAAVQSPNLPLL